MAHLNVLSFWALCYFWNALQIGILRLSWRIRPIWNWPWSVHLSYLSDIKRKSKKYKDDVIFQSVFHVESEWTNASWAVEHFEVGVNYESPRPAKRWHSKRQKHKWKAGRWGGSKGLMWSVCVQLWRRTCGRSFACSGTRWRVASTAPRSRRWTSTTRCRGRRATGAAGTRESK